MNPIQQLILNILGQVGAVHIGIDPPDNTKLLWCKIDAQGAVVVWNDYTRGYWGPVAKTDVIDNFTSSSTTAAASARTVSVLFNYYNQLNNIQGNYVEIITADQPGGYAKVNPSTGKIDPALVDLDSLKPIDVWDASSGQEPSANPDNKDYWIVNVAGNFNLNGITNWGVGDRALYINNNWQRIPAATINSYNALDQTSDGFVLDARMGKALNDLITAANDAITDLTNRLGNAEQAVIDLGNEKQANVIYLNGTIQSDQYTNTKLEDLDIDACIVLVNGQGMTSGMLTKPFVSDTIDFPAGLYDDGTEIKITHIPQ